MFKTLSAPFPAFHDPRSTVERWRFVVNHPLISRRHLRACRAEWSPPLGQGPERLRDEAGRRDSGFGLLEVAISIAVLGILSVGIASTVANMAIWSARLDERAATVAAGTSAVSLVVGAPMADPCSTSEASAMLSTTIPWAEIDGISLDCSIAGVVLVEVEVAGDPFRSVRVVEVLP